MVYSVLVSKYYFEKYFSVECNVKEWCKFEGCDSHIICDCGDKENNVTQSVAQRSWVVW